MEDLISSFKKKGGGRERQSVVSSSSEKVSVSCFPFGEGGQAGFTVFPSMAVLDF